MAGRGEYVAVAVLEWGQAGGVLVPDLVALGSEQGDRGVDDVKGRPEHDGVQDQTEQTLDIVTAMPSRGDTVVGNDVWFGYRATVMPGVRIGDGAIIAAGAMVTADVLPYTIVGGNPARPIRQRFDDADIERLQRAAWWDWPADLVTEHARTIMAGTPADIERIATEPGLGKPL